MLIPFPTPFLFQLCHRSTKMSWTHLRVKMLWCTYFLLKQDLGILSQILWAAVTCPQGGDWHPVSGRALAARIGLYVIIWELDYLFFSALCAWVCVYSYLKQFSKIMKWMDSPKEQVPSENSISPVSLSKYSLLDQSNQVRVRQGISMIWFLLEHSSALSRESERAFSLNTEFDYKSNSDEVDI